MPFCPNSPAQQLSKIWLHSALQLSVVLDDAARVSQTCAESNPPICIEVAPNGKLIGSGETPSHAVCASAQVKNEPSSVHSAVAANAPDASASRERAVVTVNCIISFAIMSRGKSG